MNCSSSFSGLLADKSGTRCRPSLDTFSLQTVHCGDGLGGGGPQFLKYTDQPVCHQQPCHTQPLFLPTTPPLRTLGLNFSGSLSSKCLNPSSRCHATGRLAICFNKELDRNTTRGGQGEEKKRPGRGVAELCLRPNSIWPQV